MNIINFYVGYDSSNYGQTLAYDICRRSIIINASENINIIPLKKKNLEELGIFYRNDSTGSTEFTYTRFLVPYLNNYRGVAFFCDSDFLWNCDPIDLMKYYDPNYAVMCVKHDYSNCPTKLKMDGQTQEYYPRKNWSSLMVFNCSHPSCEKLTINAVNTESPSWLHRMSWCSDDEIGEIPRDYNYLVGYYPLIDNPKAIHYTDGGPWYIKYLNCDYSKNWLHYLSSNEKKTLKEYYNEQLEELRL